MNSFWKNATNNLMSYLWEFDILSKMIHFIYASSLPKLTPPSLAAVYPVTVKVIWN